MQPIVLIDIAGLTPRLLDHAPRLKAIAADGWVTDMVEVLPAVGSTAQATIITGKMPEEHGVVGNGWLQRSTNEVRFGQQSNRLMQAEPLYETARILARDRHRPFKTAKLFWCFNQGAAVDIAVTPTRQQSVSGHESFALAGKPHTVPEALVQRLGPFPAAAFWGPMAGKLSTEWIAVAAAVVLQDHRPDLTLVHFPHLDYDLQRHGPAGTDLPKCLAELDAAIAPLLDAATSTGTQVWVVSGYGHRDVSRPIYPNRVLRSAGYLDVRSGPFGEQLDVFASRAVAVCDHQIAHVYVPNPDDVLYVRDILAAVSGVARVVCGPQRMELRLNHTRAGDVILLAEPDAWFAYPFWQEARFAPDYAHTVAPHLKPGFDPCELFFDPRLWFPRLRVARRRVQQKLGLRTTMDVIPLDASLVRGSHGLAAEDAKDGPLLIGHGPNPGRCTPMTGVRQLLLQALELA